MFACLYHMLLQPREESWRSVLTPDVIPLLHPMAHIIVLQPRMGDTMAFLQPNKTATSTPDDIHAFITCLADLATSKTASVPRGQLYAILSADAASVRRSTSIHDAMSRYAHVIQPHSNMTVVHIADSQTKPAIVPIPLTPAQIASRAHIATTIAGEWWLLSLSHSFIITRISGFGRQPLFQSFPRDSILQQVTQIDRDAFRREKRCRAAKDFHTLERVADDWTAI